MWPAGEHLCPLCGEGILAPVGSGYWGQCSACHRATDMHRLAEIQAEKERKALENEIQACMREDQERGEPGGDSGNAGKSKKPKPPKRGQEPQGGTSFWDKGDRSTVKTKAAKQRITVRQNPRLQSIVQRLQLSAARVADAIRLAIEEALRSE